MWGDIELGERVRNRREHDWGGGGGGVLYW